jgi:hypothetical protein
MDIALRTPTKGVGSLSRQTCFIETSTGSLAIGLYEYLVKLGVAPKARRINRLR